MAMRTLPQGSPQPRPLNPVHRGTQDSGRLRAQKAEGLCSASGGPHPLPWAHMCVANIPGLKAQHPLPAEPPGWNHSTKRPVHLSPTIWQILAPGA